MINQNTPAQFEFLLEFNNAAKVVGKNLTGDIDYMFGRKIFLYPQDDNLKTVLSVTPALVVTDTNANTIEAEVEIIINVYKYEFPLNEMDLYGLFCHAYIMSYYLIAEEMAKQGLLHNNQVYKPTRTIPSFEAVKSDIMEEIKRVYG